MIWDWILLNSTMAISAFIVCIIAVVIISIFGRK